MDWTQILGGEADEETAPDGSGGSGGGGGGGTSASTAALQGNNGPRAFAAAAASARGATEEEEPVVQLHAAWTYYTRAGRRAAAKGAGPRTFYGSCQAYSTTVNYILGIGALGVPYAFQQAGLGLSIAVTAATVSALLAHSNAAAAAAVALLVHLRHGQDTDGTPGTSKLSFPGFAGQKSVFLYIQIHFCSYIYSQHPQIYMTQVLPTFIMHTQITPTKTKSHRI